MSVDPPDPATRPVRDEAELAAGLVARSLEEVDLLLLGGAGEEGVSGP